MAASCTYVTGEGEAPRRYLCKGDYDDGGQYCLGFGGASVDRRLGQELLKVISPLGVEASLRALEELSAGDAAQRVALSSKLEQLEYEAKRLLSNTMLLTPGIVWRPASWSVAGTKSWKR